MKLENIHFPNWLFAIFNSSLGLIFIYC